MARHYIEEEELIDWGKIKHNVKIIVDVANLTPYQIMRLITKLVNYPVNLNEDFIDYGDVEDEVFEDNGYYIKEFQIKGIFTADKIDLIADKIEEFGAECIIK